MLPAVAPNREICRIALLRSLREKPGRVDFLFEGLHRLGISQDDSEAFEAAQQAWSDLSAPVYRDQWREYMIQIFPRHPVVRSLALEELTHRDGAIAAVARSYSNDRDVVLQVLQVLAPQPRAAREQLISTLETIAPANSIALAQLDAARQDTDGDVSFEATVSWVSSLTKRNAIEERHVEELVNELGVVGPHFESRRAAAVLGLAIAQPLERFAGELDPQGKPLTVSMTRASLRGDDRYLRRLLEQWDGLVRGLGGEAQVFERLGMTPEGLLPEIDPGHPNAQRVFELLMQQVPSHPHLLRHVLISAVARFAPRSNSLRELVLSTLTGPSPLYWPMLVAGETLAQDFADDRDLRDQVVGHILGAQPGQPDAVLADLLLHHPDPQLEAALRERTRDTSYDVATHFKLVAALSVPPKVIESLENFLRWDLSEPERWHLPRWIPAILKRIEQDSAVQDCLQSALAATTSPSVKASFVSLLARATGVDERLRMFATNELERTQSEPLPQVGFDLSSQSYRLVRHVLLETLG